MCKTNLYGVCKLGIGEGFGAPHNFMAQSEEVDMLHEYLYATISKLGSTQRD